MALVDPHWKSTTVRSFHISHATIIHHLIVLAYYISCDARRRRWDYIQDGQTLLKDMDRLEAFYKGMSTWARWVDLNVDPSKTKVFFQGISPTHYT